MTFQAARKMKKDGKKPLNVLHTDTFLSFSTELNANGLCKIYPSDIKIYNVFFKFHLGTQINLQALAHKGYIVEHKNGSRTFLMKIRSPPVTAIIHASGNVLCSGCSSEFEAKIACKRIARTIQNLGYNIVEFYHFKITKVYGLYKLPCPIDVISFSKKFKFVPNTNNKSNPLVTLKIKELETTMKIFCNGSMIAVAASKEIVYQAIKYVCPLVYPFGQTNLVDIKNLTTCHAETQIRNSEAIEPSDDNISRSEKNKKTALNILHTDKYLSSATELNANMLCKNQLENINIYNIITEFHLGTRINLQELARIGCNVEYKNGSRKLTMKLRSPPATASILGSGKITCSGCSSEYEAKIACRRIARIIQKLGFKGVEFNSFNETLVHGIRKLPCRIDIARFSEKYKFVYNQYDRNTSVNFKIEEPTVKMKIISDGSIIAIGARKTIVDQAIKYVYSLVHPFEQTNFKEIKHLTDCYMGAQNLCDEATETRAL